MRLFLICAFCAVLIAAAGCSRQGPTGVSVDSTFKPFVASDAVALVQLDLQALRKTPLYQRHQAAIQAEGFDQMAERVGIDPRRDVTKLFVVWDGKEPLALAKGEFPAQTIDAKLTSLGAQRTSYKNYTLFGNPARSGAEAVAFVGGDLAVAGALPAVHQALDGRGSGALPDALREQLSQLQKNDQVWEVSSGPLLANVHLPSDVESALSNISSYITLTRAGIAVDSGVRVDAHITCISEEGAHRVRDALRGSIGLARLATNNNNLDLLRLWDSFKVSQSSQSVDVTADLSADLIDKLIANVPQIKNRARQELQQH